MLRNPVGRGRSSKSAAAFLFILTEKFTLRLRIGKKPRHVSGRYGALPMPPTLWRSCESSRIRQCSGCERMVTSCLYFMGVKVFIRCHIAARKEAAGPERGEPPRTFTYIFHPSAPKRMREIRAPRARPKLFSGGLIR